MDLSQLFGQQPPQYTEEEEAQVAAFNAAAQAFNLGQRETFVRWAMVYCGCRPWPGNPRDPLPPQNTCIVHSGFMLTEDGRIL